MNKKDSSDGGNSTLIWKEITTEEQISEIVEASHKRPQLIFKHSTRCSVSSKVKGRLERDWNLKNVQPWYLSLRAYRDVSNAIASQLGVQHQSPQAILLKDGIVVYDDSHSSISVAEIAKAA